MWKKPLSFVPLLRTAGFTGKSLVNLFVWRKVWEKGGESYATSSITLLTLVLIIRALSNWHYLWGHFRKGSGWSYKPVAFSGHPRQAMAGLKGRCILCVMLHLLWPCTSVRRFSKYLRSTFVAPIWWYRWQTNYLWTTHSRQYFIRCTNVFFHPHWDR